MQKAKKVTHNKNIKIVAMITCGVVAVVVACYITLLIMASGEPFWFRGGQIYFGPSSCTSDNERLHCGDTEGLFGQCACEARQYSNGQEVFLDDKPMIYLYPESITDLRITLGKPFLLTSSYPQYVDGWNVTAYPNGDLVDKNSGKKFYALYWEGRRDIDSLDMTTGFVVKGSQSAEFLEEKLGLLGLNYKETEEFIVYWLPKLEANKYNFVYFASNEEIEKEMPLHFSIEPDTIIRINMLFKGLDDSIQVNEQILTPAPERKGFTVVEWGGTDFTQ